MFDLLRAYAALVSVHKLQYPSNASFSDIHDFVLNEICLSPHFERYPPSTEYQLSFWRWMINRLESDIKDEEISIDERLYARLFQAMSTTSPRGMLESAQSPPRPTFVTHFWKPGASPRPFAQRGVILGMHTMTLFESRTTIEAGTTGLRTWRASFALARFLISHTELVRNATVLELGSGTGFVGIVTASIQVSHHDDDAAPSMALTDVNDEVLRRCFDNINLPCNISASHPAIETRLLDWEDALSELRILPLRQYLRNLRPDIVLGADLLYHPDIIPALLAALVLALEPRRETSVAYLALTLRNPTLFASFLVTAGELDLFVTELSSDEYENCPTQFVEGLEGEDQTVKLLRITLSAQ